MKKFKFCIFYSLISLVATMQSAFANKEGYYIDGSILSNKVNHSITVNDISGESRIINQLHPSGAGTVPLFAFNLNSTKAGASIKLGRKMPLKHYKFISNGFFIAPSIAYEYIDNTATDNNGFEYTVQDRVIIDASFGYDFNRKLSAYLSYGISDVGYKVTAVSNQNYSSFLNGGNPIVDNDFGSYTNRSSSDIFGLGIKYKTTKKLYVVLEYSRQDLNLDSKHGSGSGGVTYITSTSKIDTFRIGISKNL